MNKPRKSILLYDYLKKKQKQQKCWFSCPSKSEIFRDTGITFWEQQIIIDYLITNKFIEKQNLTHIQHSTDCPTIIRNVRCLV